MKTTLIWTLVVVNVLLLGALIWQRWPENIAQAQVRRPGDYLMVPVDFQGARAGAVIVLDSTNGELSALMTDDGARPPKINGMPPIKLTEIFDRAGPGAGPGRGTR